MEIESEILKPLEKKEEISDIKLESTSERFYSPLVKSIAKKESISKMNLTTLVEQSKWKSYEKRHVKLFRK